MNCSNMLRAIMLVLVALLLTGCGGGKECLTVSEVWQNADSLEGKRVCVRGQADFRLLPHHPMQVGGCIPETEGVDLPRIVGELALLDQDPNGSEQRLSISEADLQCEGNVCSVVCRPFAPSAQATWGGTETITLRGTVNGEEQLFRFEDQRFVEEGGEPFIPRLWATRAIGHMMQQIRLHGEDDELVQSIVNLSTRYGIITPYTSFLIEEDDIFAQIGDDDMVLDDF